MAGIDISVYVEDPTTQLLTYTSIRLYRDTAPDGTFATLVATTALVAATTSYTINDPSGSSLQWYRYSFYNATGPVESTKSAVFRVTSQSLNAIASEANRRVAGGWAGTCSAAGTASSLIDVTLRDSGLASDFAESQWLYRPNAAAADRLRRVAVAGFTTATGAFTPSRVWGVAPAQDEVYQVFGFFPPTDMPGEPWNWSRAVREGIRILRQPDLITLGKGTGSQIRFALLSFAGYLTQEQIRAIWLRRTINSQLIDRNAAKEGRYWRVEENAEGAVLVLNPAPSASDTVLADVLRDYVLPYGDSDATDCPFELAVRATAFSAYRYLNSKNRVGKYAAEVAGALADLLEEASRYRVEVEVIGT